MGIDSFAIETKKDAMEPTQQDWEALFIKYPELKPVPETSCAARKCGRNHLPGDKYCIKHTHKGLKKYDIPWMCNATIKKRWRCTHNKLVGEDVCKLHKSYEHRTCTDPKTKKKVQFKTLSKLGNAANKAKQQECKERELAHQIALKSTDRTTWAHLKEWQCQEVKSLRNLLEETINRVRRGTISCNEAKTIAELTEQIIRIYTAETEILPAHPVESGPDIEMEKAAAVVADQKKILSLKDRLAKMADKHNKKPTTAINE